MSVCVHELCGDQCPGYKTGQLFQSRTQNREIVAAMIRIATKNRAE